MTIPLRLSASSKTRVAHLVSLKNLGGVERFFTRFYTHHVPALDHHVLLQTDGIHPLLKPAYAASRARVHSMKGPKGLKIPRLAMPLRHLWQRRVLDQHNIEAILVWNKISNHPVAFPDNRPVVHYERGAAWLAEASSSADHYLRRIDGVVCNSFAALRFLQLKWGLSESIPHCVLHNSIMLPGARSAHPADRFRLGFSGRLTALKAPVVALESFAELKKSCPHAEFWIAGQGPMRPVLETLVARWGLQESVTFCGLLDDMSDFYASLDAFICPSWREPFGNVVQEALAHGVPVIGGAVDGIAEQIVSGENGVLLTPSRNRQALAQYGEICIQGPREVYSPLEDNIVEAGILEPGEVAACLAQWAESPALRKQLGDQGRTRVKRDFNLDRYGERLADFMHGIVHGPAS